MMSSSSFKCGCVVDFDFVGWNNTLRNVEIDYCPRHKAAPEMYDRLKEARDAIGLLIHEHGAGMLGWEKVYEPPNSYKYPLAHELLHHIDDALALADGSDGGGR